MNKGRLSILAAILVLVISFSVRKVLTSQKEAPQRISTVRIPSVEVFRASPREISATLPLTGKLEALNRIELYAEVSGVLLAGETPFLAGTRVSKGNPIVSLDPTEARANLIAQKSAFRSTVTNVLSDIKLDFPKAYRAWLAYVNTTNLEEPLAKLPEIVDDRLERFLDSRNVQSSYFNVKASEERLSKYVLSAPFNGVISEALIKPGTLVRVGQKIGSFTQPNSYELEVAIPVQDLKFIATGQEVTLSSDDVPGKWTGKVARINAQVDAASQTVHVYIHLNTSDLYEGTYLNGYIKSEPMSDAIELNRKLISDQSEIYVVEGDSLNRIAVQVLRYEGANALVRGVKAGTLILAEVLPGGTKGMKVSASEQ